LTDYIKQQSNPISFPINGQSWVVLSDVEKRIKEKIENIGKPLKEWDISINYGIKTGCNEAFIIDKDKRDELIKKDAKSAEIIRPILRGRDIKRYGYDFAELYLLFIPWHFPLHLDTSITGVSKEAEKIFKEKYSAVYNHLNQYKELLSARNTAETGIRYEWYALQRWGANYWNDFSKQKIIYPNMTKFLPFYYDTRSFITNQKCFIITGNHMAFLTAFLNSSIFKFCFRDNFPELLGGTRELSKIFFNKIPVLQVNNEINKLFETTIMEIQELKIKKVETKEKEIEIDNMILNLYQLSEKEKRVINFHYL